MHTSMLSSSQNSHSEKKLNNNHSQFENSAYTYISNLNNGTATKVIEMCAKGHDQGHMMRY